MRNRLFVSYYIKYLVVLSDQTSARCDLICTIFGIMYSLLMTSNGAASIEKFEAWLKNSHPVVNVGSPTVPLLAKGTSLYIGGEKFAEALCRATVLMSSELSASFSHIASEGNNQTTSTVEMGLSVSRLFSALLFWLASSEECSQNAGMSSWQSLTKILESVINLPLHGESLAVSCVLFTFNMQFHEFDNTGFTYCFCL